MTQINLELDDSLVERLRQRAALDGDSLEVYLRRQIESHPIADPFRGAIDENLIDELLDEVMTRRYTFA